MTSSLEFLISILARTRKKYECASLADDVDMFDEDWRRSTPLRGSDENGENGEGGDDSTVSGEMAIPKKSSGSLKLTLLLGGADSAIYLPCCLLFQI